MAYQGLLLVSMLCIAAGVTARGSRWSPKAQGLGSDLDSLLCAPKKHPRIIIDIHESISRGAELLDGVWSRSMDACVTGCCDTRGCDLALFKNEGASKTGKNCYYVHCGLLNNCVMVEHSSFTTITFLNGERTREKGEGSRGLTVLQLGICPQALA
jgi:hypothetical protein